MPEQKWKKLGTIARIQAGYQERTDSRDYNSNMFRIVQGGDINECNRVDWFRLKAYTINRDFSNYIIKKNDILILARGENHKAIFIDKNEKNTIAGHSFYILRIKDKDILPQYLHIILNSRDIQGQLCLLSGGAIVSFIRKNALESVKIPVPDITIQEQIISTYDLIRRKKQIISMLEKKYDRILTGTIHNMLFKGGE